MRVLLIWAVLFFAAGEAASPQPQRAGSPGPPHAGEIDRLAAAVEPELIAWRRHLHQHPELSNREFETAKFIAERLRSFGLEPQTGVARTGVVAVLKGGRPGPVVALRADMDALPVREEVDLPFASKATGEYEGNTVGVMHACGHDAHMAILLAAARMLTQMRERVPGTVKLIFQPAEEGAPPGETPAGAQLMVKEGVMQNPKVDAVFGLHVFANVPAGQITYRSGPFMAASDSFEIIVKGRQTHGSAPWRGVDPIVTGAQIVTALQTIVSRSVDITVLPAIVTVGQFQSGVRNNIIPDAARLVGTIRTFDDKVQDDIHARVKRIAEGIAAGAGASVDVRITRGYPVTANDPTLTARMLPTLERVAPGLVKESELITGAEDFTFFQREAPGLFFFLGITPKDQVGKAPANHSPLFYVEEKALITGARALANLALDYLSAAR
ncbi:MAG TPA: amidohydrolase [Vicinamibacterales bacterium]|nr:amidohydrolase [Vicinamibacterales bacterium]